jgi:hypothetical protein
MPLLKAIQVRNGLPIPSANSASEVIVAVGDYVIKTGDAAGDVVEMCPLPAGYVPVEVVVDNQPLAGTSVGNVGILSGNFNDMSPSRTCGAEFNSAANFATAGIKRNDVAGSNRIAPTTNDRSIGVVLTSLTPPTIGNRMRMTVLLRPQSEGV